MHRQAAEAHAATTRPLSIRACLQVLPPLWSHVLLLQQRRRLLRAGGATPSRPVDSVGSAIRLSSRICGFRRGHKGSAMCRLLLVACCLPAAAHAACCLLPAVEHGDGCFGSRAWRWLFNCSEVEAYVMCTGALVGPWTDTKTDINPVAGKWPWDSDHVIKACMGNRAAAGFHADATTSRSCRQIRV